MYEHAAGPQGPRALVSPTAPAVTTTLALRRISNALTFFACNGKAWACARSRLGGTMLLAPSPPKGDRHLGSW